MAVGWEGEEGEDKEGDGAEGFVLEFAECGADDAGYGNEAGDEVEDNLGEGFHAREVWGELGGISWAFGISGELFKQVVNIVREIAGSNIDMRAI